MLKPALMSAFVLAVSVFASAQASRNQDSFSFIMTGPAVTVELQVEYVLRDDSGQPQPASKEVSTVKFRHTARVVLGTALAGKPAKSLQAYAFLPGCQFDIVTADLTTGVRRADLQCKTLPSIPLHGRVSVPQFAGKKIEVTAFYNVRWAGKFFGLPRPVRKIFLANTQMETDGSFAFDLPDFTADPLWDSLSHDASLTFILGDTSNGMPLAELSAPSDLSLGSGLKVAARYPSEIEFGVR
ncbi:MAG TPA: hypothetical protein VJW20_15180 [Candidatus Angelobacter sp.]|nr:hypothetical protein [Candidatus Angelobacter sp.]